MTQDEIEHMWKVASNNPNFDTNWNDPVVIAFAKLVAQPEREACAKVCDVLAYHPEFASDATKLAAMAIRARGQ